MVPPLQYSAVLRLIFSASFLPFSFEWKLDWSGYQVQWTLDKEGLLGQFNFTDIIIEIIGMIGWSFPGVIAGQKNINDVSSQNGWTIVGLRE